MIIFLVLTVYLLSSCTFYRHVFHSCVWLEIWPVDDISESVFAVGWVNGRTGVAGNEVGGIMEQVDIDQVQTSAENTHTQAKYGDMWQVEKVNRKQSDNTKAWHLIGEHGCHLWGAFLSMSALVLMLSPQTSTFVFCAEHSLLFFGCHWKTINVHPTNEPCWLTAWCCSTDCGLLLLLPPGNNTAEQIVTKVLRNHRLYQQHCVIYPGSLQEYV